MLLSLAAAATAPAATFYCDPVQGTEQGDGSAQRPWPSIEKVIASKRIQLYGSDGKIANPDAPVKPGDVVLLRTGWHGVIRISGGYNNQPITIAAEAGHTPQVGWVEIGEGRRWVIKGLTISPSLAPAAMARVPRDLVSLGERGGEESGELVVEDCFIYSVLDASKWSGDDWVKMPASGIWLGRHGQGHIARNNYILNTRFGINLCAPACIAEGNIVANFSGDGIRTTRDGQIVQYNVIKNCYASAADGDDNHDDGIQAFLFNAGRGTLRDITIRGNIIIAHERDDQRLPNAPQGIGFFDGPLVHFTIEKNVICVNHWHGISLYDAQDCTIQENACFSRWGGRAKPWVMLGQKRQRASGNTVRNNIAHTFSFKADPQVRAENNRAVSEEEFKQRLAALAAVIDGKFGRLHPTAKRPRLEQAEAVGRQP